MKIRITKYKVQHKGKVYIVESHLERKFLKQWLKRHPRIPPTTQHTFFPSRKWRFDFFWPDLNLAVEIQGFGPGHNSREGMYNDANKHNAAMSKGYDIIYFTGKHLLDKNIEGTCRYLHYIMRLRSHREARTRR